MIRTFFLYPVVLTGCLGAQVESGEWLPGGDTTNTLLLGSNAFIFPADNIEVENEPSFYTGNSFLDMKK